MLKSNEEIFESVARKTVSVPWNRRANILEKQRTFVDIAADIIQRTYGGDIPANTENCLTVWYHEFGSFGPL